MVVLSGVPEIGFDVPREYMFARLLQREAAQPPTRAAYQARNANAERVISSIAADRPVRLLPVVDLLCQETCQIARDDVLLYSDDDHLSEAGAKWLVAELLSGPGGVNASR